MIRPMRQNALPRNRYEERDGLGDIRRRPNASDLLYVENRVKGFLAGLAASIA